MPAAVGTNGVGVMRWWGRGTVVLAGAAALSLVGASAADAATTATWGFAEVPPGSQVPGGTAFGTVPVYASSRTTLRTVARGADSALDVAAWRDIAPGGKVDRWATALSSDPGFESSRVFGSDGDASTFDMGAGDFSVSVWLRPTPAPQFPRGSLRPEKVSPNVVQKGRANAPGGFWKIYLQMVRSGGVEYWAPACVIKGGDGRSAKLGTGTSAIPLANGAGVTVTCSRNAGVLRLAVTPDGGATRTIGRNASTIDVSNAEALSVAHKPGTRNAADVYDGLLDDLAVSMG